MIHSTCDNKLSNFDFISFVILMSMHQIYDDISKELKLRLGDDYNYVCDSAKYDEVVITIFKRLRKDSGRQKYVVMIIINDAEVIVSRSQTTIEAHIQLGDPELFDKIIHNVVLADSLTKN